MVDQLLGIQDWILNMNAKYKANKTEDDDARSSPPTSMMSPNMN